MKQKKKKKEENNQKKGKKQNGRLIKDKIIRDIRSPFEDEYYYQPRRVGTMNTKVMVDKSSNLSLDECLNKIKAYLRDRITDLQSWYMENSVNNCN